MAMTKKQYVLEGLCCGNCADKIEKDLRLLPGVKSATVNVDTAILSIESDAETDALLKDITRIAVSHDEDIVVKKA